ncbi:hypothetical protein GCM10007423_00790 [Dyadobacter endophyticus]|uniref:Uncharacterized protein n=1 Tax=Dyadobacter endophyticus TaxID=1749036 RepID=A0ABQ1YCL5_9BACT|nr:hypothetical protein GCM10007423_00790 [Dyadobacter endophyticus]
MGSAQKVKIWMVSLWALLYQDAFATAQNPDRLIYMGDTLSIFANPLEELYKTDSLRPQFFANKRGCITTGPKLLSCATAPLVF